MEKRLGEGAERASRSQVVEVAGDIRPRASGGSGGRGSARRLRDLLNDLEVAVVVLSFADSPSCFSLNLRPIQRVAHLSKHLFFHLLVMAFLAEGENPDSKQDGCQEQDGTDDGRDDEEDFLQDCLHLLSPCRTGE